MYLCLSDMLADKLYSAATARVHNAFCDTTRKAYMAMFRLYLGFLSFMNWDPSQVTVPQLLVFLEFLVANNFSYSQICNHLSGIKAFANIYGLSEWPFSHVQVKYFLRSLQIRAPIMLTLKKIIDIPLLKGIVTQCDATYMGQVFTALYLMAFFSFLRLSHFVPHSITLSSKNNNSFYHKNII